MYRRNKLTRLAHRIKGNYGHIVLDSDYKTALFRGHIDGATEHLKKAGELLGDTCIEDDDVESDFFNYFLAAVVVLLIAFTIFAYFVLA